MPDQIHACCLTPIEGSIKNGYDSNASIDAKFDSANKRYGLAPGRARANQVCTIGLVVESITYGRPITPASKARMPKIGFASPAGFQKSPAITGSTRQLAASRAVCTQACFFGASLRAIKSG